MALPQPRKHLWAAYRLLLAAASLAAAPLSCSPGGAAPPAAAAPSAAAVAPEPEPDPAASSPPTSASPPSSTLALTSQPGPAVDPNAVTTPSTAPTLTTAPPAGPPSPLHRLLDEISSDLQQGRIDASGRRLASMIRDIDRDGQLDERIVAHALMGRIHNSKKGVAQAGAEYAKVRELWMNPSEAAQRVGVQGEADAVRYVRLGRALNGVGEAVFYAAEQKRIRTVDPLRFPEYRGTAQARPPSKALQDMTPAERDRELARRKAETESVRRHIEGPVREWVARKQRAIEDAEKEYVKVLELQPVPPPRWVLASAARVGRMWGDFADDFRKAPIPAWMKADTELLSVYQGLVGSATDPQTQRARAAFETCRNLATRYHLEDEYSAECARWLDAHP